MSSVTGTLRGGGTVSIDSVNDRTIFNLNGTYSGTWPSGPSYPYFGCTVAQGKEYVDLAMRAAVMGWNITITGTGGYMSGGNPQGIASVSLSPPA